MEIPEEARAIAEEIERRMNGVEYADAMLWQYPHYVDRLGFVLDPERRIVMVSFLRPADACGRSRAGCSCWLPEGHDDEAHVCGCGGSWRPDHSIIRYPGAFADLAVTDADQRRRPFRGYVTRGGIRTPLPIEETA